MMGAEIQRIQRMSVLQKAVLNLNEEIALKALLHNSNEKIASKGTEMLKYITFYSQDILVLVFFWNLKFSYDV